MDRQPLAWTGLRELLTAGREESRLDGPGAPSRPKDSWILRVVKEQEHLIRKKVKSSDFFF